MARVPLSINEYVEGVATLRVKKGRGGVKMVRFIVDTGAPRTVISYEDFRNLQIPVASGVGEVVEIGGAKYRLQPLGRSWLLLQAEGGGRVTCEFGAEAAIPTKEVSSAAWLPTIVGLDFLEGQDLRLVVAPSGEGAYLEKL